MAKDKLIKIRCTQEFKTAVEEQAKAERRDVSDFCRIVLEDYVANYRRTHPKPENPRDATSSAYILNETKDAAPPAQKPPTPKRRIPKRDEN